MTLPGGPGGPRPIPGAGKPAPDPERVLSQALRAMAGGGKPDRTEDGAGSPPSPGGKAPRTSLSVLQVLLIATIFGLLVGITVGLITLLV